MSDGVTTWDLLTRVADAHPERPALILPRRSISYGELRDRAARTAAALAGAGVHPGDRVALAVHSSIEWAVWFHAVGRLGGIVVPVDPRSPAAEVASTLARSGAVAALVGDSCPAAVEAASWSASRAGLRLLAWDDESPPRPPAVRLDTTDPDVLTAPPPGPDTPVIIQYTSGSTAAPKGAVLAHRAVTGVGAGFGQRLGLRPAERLFSGSPFFHVGGTVLLLATAAAAGATAVALPAFDAEAALAIMERERCVVFSGVEAHFLLVLDAPGFDPVRLASVRAATSTGSPTVLRRISGEMDIPGMVALYGLSETASNLTMCRVDDPVEWRLDTCGYPHAGTEVRIVAPGTDESVAAGEVGEIVARGFSVMLGYWDQPDETAAATTADGWLRTGDLGRLGDDGLLRFEGRSKDMLRVGGENVAVAEVEQVLLGLPEIRQAAVVGRDHARLGQVPVAFVTTTGPVDHAELLERVAAHLAERLASFKHPREVTVLDELPLTGSGKVHKPTLRALVSDSPPSPPA